MQWILHHSESINGDWVALCKHPTPAQSPVMGRALESLGECLWAVCGGRSNGVSGTGLSGPTRHGSTKASEGRPEELPCSWLRRLCPRPHPRMQPPGMTTISSPGAQVAASCSDSRGPRAAWRGTSYKEPGQSESSHCLPPTCQVHTTLHPHWSHSRLTQISLSSLHR